MTRTPDELVKETRELCAKATPGPWVAARGDVYGDGGPLRGERNLIADTARLTGEDAALIARSRTLLEELADALEQTSLRSRIGAELVEGARQVAKHQEAREAALRKRVDDLWEETKRLHHEISELKEGSGRVHAHYLERLSEAHKERDEARAHAAWWKQAHNDETRNLNAVAEEVDAENKALRKRVEELEARLEIVCAELRTARGWKEKP